MDGSDADGTRMKTANVSLAAHCCADIDPSLALLQSERERNPRTRTHREVIAEQLKMERRTQREVTACLLWFHHRFGPRHQPTVSPAPIAFTGFDN